MAFDIQLALPAELALDDAKLREHLHNTIPDLQGTPFQYQILKKSIDARKKPIVVNLTLHISPQGDLPSLRTLAFPYADVSEKPSVVIIGAGPAGLFAALRLLELGIKPIVLERGKNVQERRRDLANLNKEHLVDANSNYCFGEGGAGTYSDGKLYTRSNKRGDIRRILEIFVAHGATEQILVEAHPHIGTNKLPKVVENLRKTILQYGGEIHFNHQVVDFTIENHKITAVHCQNGTAFKGLGVILATGHSARDIFYLLDQKKITIEAKPFAMGVRIEHAQSFVDTCQYKSKTRGLLPAAAYSLVEQTYFQGVQRGVFSFCMCPGGFIVPASTAQNELVVNGMSPSKRDSYFANSGVVVSIDPSDWAHHADKGALAALAFQAEIEQKAWQMAKHKAQHEGNSQIAPAQNVSDFLQGKTSKNLVKTSYQPGLIPIDFNQILPACIAEPLKTALKVFARRMQGYEHGQMIGIESRTSSPVRIPREKDTLVHPQIHNLFPCGEGAGYAGGIVSAAMDGERCAERTQSVLFCGHSPF